jgi:hypothetical protein
MLNKIFNLSILLGAIGITPIYGNFGYSDVIIMLLFAISPIRIAKYAVQNVIYRTSTPLYTLFALALMVVGIFSSSITGHFTGTIQYLFVWFIFIPVLLYYSQGRIKSIIIPYIVGALLSLYLLYSFIFFDLTLFTTFFEYKLTGGVFHRYSVGATNDYGFILAISIIFSYFGAMYSYGKNRLFYIMVIFMLIPALIFTGSKSSVLLLLSFAVLVFAFSRIRLRNKIISILIFIVTVLFFTIPSTIGSDHLFYNVIRLIDIYNISDRLHHFKIGFELFSNNIFTAHYGIGGYQNSGVDIMPLHNIFLAILVETGLFPLIFFILFFTVILYMSYRSIKEYTPYMFSLIISILLYMLTIGHVYDRMFWVPIAVAFLLYHKKYRA